MPLLLPIQREIRRRRALQLEARAMAEPINFCTSYFNEYCAVFGSTLTTIDCIIFRPHTVRSLRVLVDQRTLLHHISFILVKEDLAPHLPFMHIWKRLIVRSWKEVHYPSRTYAKTSIFEARNVACRISQKRAFKFQERIAHICSKPMISNFAQYFWEVYKGTMVNKFFKLKVNRNEEI